MVSSFTIPSPSNIIASEDKRADEMPVSGQRWKMIKKLRSAMVPLNWFAIMIGIICE